MNTIPGRTHCHVMTIPRHSVLVSLLMLIGANAATAQDAEVDEQQPQASAKDELRTPKYFGLRYKEDWTYLEGDEGSYVADIFDPLKNLDLGGDWRMDIGGSVRMRVMSETNKLFGARQLSQDTYLLQQYLLHANIRYKDEVRFFIEGIHAQVDERQTPVLGIDENRYDIHQAFVDVKPFGGGTPLTFRLGRQEILFGNQRLVSPFPWGNIRRRFDGVDLLWRDEQWALDAFYVRPVPVDRSEGLDRKLDEYDEDQHFFGVHSTYSGWQDHGLDLYYLVLLDSRPSPNSAGLSSQLTLHTIGSRWWGSSGPWDYEAEGALQLGHHSGDEVFAWMIALEGGYTFQDWPATPRLAVGFDWATGDHDPNDNEHNTFNQLFPLGHKYFGYLDQVGRQNIIDPHIELSFSPCEPVRMSVAYHHFFLDQNDDALYNAGGAAYRRDVTGDSGSAVGGELDVVMKWKIDLHQSLELGWAHLWPGSFIDQTGDNDEADLLYLQYVFTF